MKWSAVKNICWFLLESYNLSISKVKYSMKCNNKRLPETPLPTVLLMHLPGPATYKGFSLFNNPESSGRKQTPKLVPLQCGFGCAAAPRSGAFITVWMLNKIHTAAPVPCKNNLPKTPKIPTISPNRPNLTCEWPQNLILLFFNSSSIINLGQPL